MGKAFPLTIFNKITTSQTFASFTFHYLGWFVLYLIVMITIHPSNNFHDLLSDLELESLTLRFGDTDCKSRSETIWKTKSDLMGKTVGFTCHLSQLIMTAGPLEQWVWQPGLPPSASCQGKQQRGRRNECIENILRKSRRHHAFRQIPPLCIMRLKRISSILSH